MTGITYTPLHPTFIAEVHGADLTKPTQELVDELKAGLAKVSPAPPPVVPLPSLLKL
jgi:hypothetical protein